MNNIVLLTINIGSLKSQVKLKSQELSGQRKTMLLLIHCLLALIAQAAAMVTDPAAKLSTKIKENQIAVIRAINECRRKANPPACNMVEAVWNEEAYETASRYAKLCKPEHSQQSERILPSGLICGENLFFASYAASWEEAIGAFCNESKDFIHGTGPNTPGAQIGHYTQTVWFNSYLSACEIAYCPNNEYKFFVVCHQCPAGNILGSIHIPYKKGTPCSKCPNHCNDGLCTNPCPINPEPQGCDQYKDLCGVDIVKQSCPGTCGCTNGEIF